MPPRRLPIRFERAYAVLSSALLLRPAAAYVELDEREVRVRMAWAFRARFPRAAVVAATPWTGRTLSRGVHGFRGRWLVNGAGTGIVEVTLRPAQRAWVLGFPIRLGTLLVSVEDPAALVAELVPPSEGAPPTAR